MALDELLLEILRCPETHAKLKLADDELVARLNAAIAAGTLLDRGGQAVDQPIDAALVREPGDIAYPVRDEIPDMLIDSGIVLANVS